MSSATDILKNLDRRVSALESERLDDAAAGALTSILKLFADFEVEVKLNYRLHRYHLCGQVIVGQGAISWDEMQSAEDFESLEERDWNGLSAMTWNDMQKDFDSIGYVWNDLFNLYV
ncbi:hypothetical protein PghCCS26_47880 [Paenibacillus glycanilyticus]|uniref:Uncharacterized protein n=1 Tax=Paenibacillus glycanilyticus TaxID=126569 RepID=A0ABQ6NS38_9BACL|nr:hypothetical protein [Paenibacillus glycanilyticus]GMK47658.1 hypothetical protein PghCCS26_47880 [Paenibacillus glycanilyticus]